MCTFQLNLFACYETLFQVLGHTTTIVGSYKDLNKNELLNINLNYKYTDKFIVDEIAFRYN